MMINSMEAGVVGLRSSLIDWKDLYEIEKDFHMRKNLIRIVNLVDLWQLIETPKDEMLEALARLYKSDDAYEAMSRGETISLFTGKGVIRYGKFLVRAWWQYHLDFVRIAKIPDDKKELLLEYFAKGAPSKLARWGLDRSNMVSHYDTRSWALMIRYMEGESLQDLFPWSEKRDNKILLQQADNWGAPYFGPSALLHGSPLYRNNLRYIEVVRWLLKPNRVEPLLKDRVMIAPGEDIPRHIRYVDYIEHLTPADVEGDPGVNVAFERMQMRIVGEARQRAEESYTEYPAPIKRETLKIQSVRTGKQLALIGKLQEHCVGLYHDRCLKGLSSIYVIDDQQGFSTLELDAQQRLVQHYGPRNSHPPEAHIRLVDEWLSR